MERRTFVGLGIGVGVSALAGCTASAFPDTGSSDPTATGSGRDGPSSPTTSPPAAEPDAACPALIEAERTVCVPDETGPLGVRRSTETLNGADWSLLVTVTNRSDASYGTNPYAWSVFRRAGDGWRRVAPDAAVEPWVELAPTEAYTWQLGTAAAAKAVDQRVFLHLDPGRYAFAVPFEGPDRVAAVATFERTT